MKIVEMKNPRSAAKVGMRAIALSVLTLMLTWAALKLAEFWSPHQATIAVQQLQDDNDVYAMARVLATFDVGQWIWAVGVLLLSLIWWSASWQWYELSRNAKSKEGDSK